jgi:hypothetical protein
MGFPGGLLHQGDSRVGLGGGCASGHLNPLLLFQFTSFTKPQTILNNF